MATTTALFGWLQPAFAFPPIATDWIATGRSSTIIINGSHNDVEVTLELSDDASTVRDSIPVGIARSAAVRIAAPYVRVTAENNDSDPRYVAWKLSD